MNDRYMAAAHAIQSAIAYLRSRDIAGGLPEERRSTGPKHLRVGVDMMKAEQAALAKLLIDRGVFTLPEYEEAITVALEVEADRYTAEARKLGGLPDSVSFR